MPRHYDQSLLRTMRAHEHDEQFEGVPITVRPIPEGGDPGDMDPRLHKSMRKMALLSHFMPKQKADADLDKMVEQFRGMFADYKGDYVVTEGVTTQNVTVASEDGHEVPVLVYKRENAGDNLPIFVYYHGGGFFGGGVHIVEQMCKLLVEKLDCIALNVDYRLCPEAHYPQPLDDCWAATAWAHDHAAELGGDPAKMVVAGDSAGGNLAAAVTLRDRDEGTDMVRMQVLLYPAVNLTGKPTGFYHGVDMAKYRMSKHHRRVLEPVLSMMGSMMNADGLLDKIYLQGYESPECIYASPLLDDFHGLPRTLLMFGEHDMLAFEDIAYARTAHAAGVNLKTVIYEGLMHGFADQIGVMPQAEDVMDEIAENMTELFA